MGQAEISTAAATDPVHKGRSSPLSLETRLADLKRRLLEISDLAGAGAILSWDQATYMPQAGAGARGRQLAMLAVWHTSGRSLRHSAGYSTRSFAMARACHTIPTTRA